MIENFENFETDENDSPEMMAQKFMERKLAESNGVVDGDEQGAEGGEPNSNEANGEQNDDSQGGETGDPEPNENDDAGKERTEGTEGEGNGGTLGGDEPEGDEPVSISHFDKVAESLGVKLSDAPQPGFLPIKRDGQIAWLSPEDYTAMAMKGTDYTKKTMALSDYKKKLEKIENAGIESADIEAMALIKSGKVKEGMALLSKTNNIEHEQLTDEILDIDEEMYNNATPTQDEEAKFSPDVIEFIKTIPQSEASGLEAISKSGKLPGSFEREMMRDKSLMSNFVTDINNGKASKIVDECYNRISLMDEFNQNNVLNNPEEYINLYIEVATDIHKTSSNGAEVPTKEPDVDEVKTESKKTIEKKNGQNFGKTHVKNGRSTVKKEVLSDIENISKMKSDPSYVDKVAKEKYGVEIMR